MTETLGYRESKKSFVEAIEAKWPQLKYEFKKGKFIYMYGPPIEEVKAFFDSYTGPGEEFLKTAINVVIINFGIATNYDIARCFSKSALEKIEEYRRKFDLEKLPVE